MPSGGRTRGSGKKTGIWMVSKAGMMTSARRNAGHQRAHAADSMLMQSLIPSSARSNYQSQHDTNQEGSCGSRYRLDVPRANLSVDQPDPSYIWKNLMKIKMGRTIGQRTHASSDVVDRAAKYRTHQCRTGRLCAAWPYVDMRK